MRITRTQLKLANNTIFVPPLFYRIKARVDILFKCINKSADFNKTRIFKQSRSYKIENGETGWKISRMWRVSWRVTAGKWRFVVCCYFVSMCHGGMWPTLSKCFAFRALPALAFSVSAQIGNQTRFQHILRILSSVKTSSNHLVRAVPNIWPV